MGMTIDEKNKFIEESKKHFKEWHDMNYIPKADYEQRLKADMVAMLEDLKQDIIAESYGIETDCSDYVVNVADIDMVIQQKIDKLKENENG